MPQVPPGAQDAAVAAELLWLLEPLRPNKEKAFLTSFFPHLGHSIESADAALRTNFSNLVPQLWQTYS